MFLLYFFISLAASVGLLLKDWIETKDTRVIEANWKKYVGCLVAGLLYGLLSSLYVFRWIAVVAVIYLVGNSFNNVWNAFAWLWSKIHGK